MSMVADLIKNKDIRNRILFTLAVLFVYRVGQSIVVPMVNNTAVMSAMTDNSLFAMMNTLGGGALEKFSILSLGVTPYITASIIIQLMAMDVIPALTEMAKAGATGRMQMDKITRYLTVALAYLQAFSLTYGFDKSYGLIENPSFAKYLYIATLLTAGTMFAMWLGDQITTKGIGNGISIIIFAGIVSNLPSAFVETYQTMVDTSSSQALFSGLLGFGAYVLVYVVIIVLVIFMETAVRKIPIQYTSSSVKRGGQDMTFLPLKINSASVIPVIFASSILMAPLTIGSFFASSSSTTYQTMTNILSMQKPIGLCLYVILIVLCTFFYSNLQVDPEKIAENLNKSGTYIPGVRPGKETEDYLRKVLNRITVLGAAFLVVVAALPYLISMFTTLPTSVTVGGTGMIIVVGVGLETMKQLKGQLTSRSYRGFIDRN